MVGKPFHLTSCQERAALTPQLTDELGPVGEKKDPTSSQAGWAEQGGLGSRLVPTVGCVPETADTWRADRQFSPFLLLADTY